MGDAFYKLYSAMQRLLAPGLRNSQYAYRDTLHSQVVPGLSWLDLGCGHQLLPSWMPGADQAQLALAQRPRILVGIDADALSLDKNKLLRDKVLGETQALPFADGTFDLITANMVMEHVQDPPALLREVYRVLKPDGIFLFHTPNLWGYTTTAARLLPQPFKIWLVHFLQRREAEDVFPTFYRINSSRRIEKLATANGFKLLKLDLIESSAQTVRLGPVVILELLLIRTLRFRLLRRFRSNIIAVLQKPVTQPGS